MLRLTVLPPEFYTDRTVNYSVALIGLFGALTFVTIVFVWALVRLTSVRIENDTAVPYGQLNGVVKLVIAGVLVLELGPGVGSWLYDVWYVIEDILTAIL